MMGRYMHSASRSNTKVLVGRPPRAAAGPLAGFLAPRKLRTTAGQGASRGPGGPPHQKTNRYLANSILLISILVTARAWGQLPEGPGKAETLKLCSNCHELERSISLHQDRDGWQATVAKMVALGVKGSDQELRTVVEYLSKNFPAEAVPKIDVNKAKAIEIESGLTLRRSEAAAIIQYREKNGPFQSIDDLKKVPGINAAKIEAKKDRLVF